MKILELRFQNLNSLYGEWCIDFTDPEYAANGIFALTGPTGAGKSTILDAVCLALYGTTPRLGKITKSSNEIMSRQTGQCSAEVTFVSQAGRFCCHWSQHRARKKPGGRLADPKHEISDALTGKPIETKKSLVPGVVEAKTGMDFERFTRSILLAQGGFDTFLKAGIEQKSKILEQITGTGIYSEISRRVHERLRDENDRLKVLQAETDGIVILDPEQEGECTRELTVKIESQTLLAGKVQQTGGAIAWLQSIERLRAELKVLEKETESQSKEEEAFKQNRERLAGAVRAAELDGEHATLASCRKQQSIDRKSLKAEEEKLPLVKAAFEKQEKALRDTGKCAEEAKAEHGRMAPLFRKVLGLDQLLLEKKKSIELGAAECKLDQQQIDSDVGNLENARQKAAKTGTEFELVLGYLELNRGDEWLVGGLAGVEVELQNLGTVQQQITLLGGDFSNKQKELDGSSEKLTRQSILVARLKKQLEKQRQQISEGKKALTEHLDDKLLREYRSEKDSLLKEMVFLQKIADLESERKRLEDGTPCPLCGSENHPFAENNIPEIGETEKRVESLTRIICSAEGQEAAIKGFEGEEKRAADRLTESLSVEAERLHEQKGVEQGLLEMKKQLEAREASMAALVESALVKLQPLGIAAISRTEVPALLGELKKRLHAWQGKVHEKTEVEKRISTFDAEIKQLGAVIDTRRRSLSKKQEIFDVIAGEFKARQVERKTLFGARYPDSEESSLVKKIREMEREEGKARKVRDDAAQRFTAMRTSKEILQENIEKRSATLEQSRNDFISTLLAAGFNNEEQFLEHRMSLAERGELTEKAKKLDDRLVELKARRKDTESRLSAEIAKKMTLNGLEELEPIKRELDEQLSVLMEEVAALKHKIASNRDARERIKEKQVAIDVQKKECSGWEKLHGLIGSADGKKYRNFAQGLTFELMVSHANRQLQKMTDRYLLIRDDQQPLELNVVDNYQAGEIRSTKNLSGGESFIVSLALALGLSKMASRTVRVDSLFLDEGFGTLDEESLETALDTLSNLQQDDKLIGVISHVPALKERIGTQIAISYLSGGRSMIRGPGCSKVERLQ